MRSMTGHGRATAEQGGWRATVEARAVNHRFLEVKLRGAALPPAVEDQVVARFRESLERGAVSVAVRLDRAGGAASPPIDLAAARAAHAALAELAASLGVPGPDLALVLAQPGVAATAGAAGAEDDPAAAGAVLAAAAGAAAALAAMRATEGAALAAELEARCAALATLVDEIASEAAAQPEELRRRLTDRLARLVEDPRLAVEPARLAQEVALLAERADVTEELVRARSHLAQARALLASDAPAGRRLDFLVQELGREFNTTGSKSASLGISRRVVDAKAELEKLREQVQNVE